MTDARASGVVVDTMVISWLFEDRLNPLASHDRLFNGAPGLQVITADDQ